MGRKRKTNSTMGQSFQSAFEDRSGSKMTLSNMEDHMDSEDEFLANREKILLDEGPDRKRLRKFREEEALLEASDEEVLDVADSDEEEEHTGNDFNEGYEEEEDMAEEMDEDMEITGKKKHVEEDELEGWGTSRKDLYGDDELETEADALAHESEARRLQMKQLEAMNDADFGFGDQDWTNSTEEPSSTIANAENVLEILPESTLDENASIPNRLKALRERHPEFEALKKEFLSLQSEFLLLSSSKNDSKSANLTASIKYQALSAYLATLTMYFALLTATANDSSKPLSKAPSELRDHDIMDALVRSRTTWMLARELQDKVVPIEPTDLMDSEEDEEEPVQRAEKQLKSSKLSAAELAQRASDKRRALRLAAVEKQFAELADLDDIALAKKPAQTHVIDDAARGDEADLNSFELAEQAAKRKSLRFYTSQITQKAMKRTAKSKEIGGDTDIPYREKWKERQARLQEEAEKKKSAMGPRGAGQQKPVDRDGGSDSDEYQNLAAKAKRQKREKKAAATAAYAEQEAENKAWYDAGDGVGTDGKRKINYQIEKNKGLAPHRKKDVRNPRVKKRKKFEEKKKKLGSIKAVYKGGPGKHGYQGELTGIKTGLVKGIKLS